MKQKREDDPLQTLTPDEVAELLCCARSSVDRLVETGQLPIVMVARGNRKRTYRIRRSVVQRFIEASERNKAR